MMMAAALTATTILVLLFVLPPEAVIWAFELYEAAEFDILPAVNYICVPTCQDVRKKILSALSTLSVVGQKPILVQFWAPKKAGKTFVLTTTHQPFGFYGRDEGLAAYCIGCLQHKLFVHREKDASFGLPGLAFKKGTPQQTANVHHVYYPKDERPPFVNEEIFSLIWGSFAVPVFLDNECVGVLEFVMMKPADSYDAEINEVCKALKFAGLQSSTKTETPKKTCNTIKIKSSKETEASEIIRRKTPSSDYARYNVLAPYFGISKKHAMEKVASKFNLYKKDGTISVTETTFTNALRKVGITEWPYIKSTSTETSESTSSSPDTVLPSWDGRVSQLPLEPTPATNTSPSETYNNEPVYEASTVADDLFNFSWDGKVSQLPLEPTPATNTSPSETYNNQPVYEAGTVADDLFNFSWDGSVSQLPLEPTPTTNTSPSETYNNQPVYEASTVADDLFNFSWDGSVSQLPLEPTPATNTSPSETYNNQPVYEASTVADDLFNFSWDGSVSQLPLEPTPATNTSPSETYNNQPVYEASTVADDLFNFSWDGSVSQLPLEPTPATNITSPPNTHNNQLAFGTSGLNSEFDGMKHQADADIDMEMVDIDELMDLFENYNE